MNFNRWKPYGRLRDVDSRDAGAGIMDIFSMEFEGEPQTQTEPAPAEPTSEEPSADVADAGSAPAETPSNPLGTETTPSADPEAPVKPETPVSVESAPASEKLLADALKAVSLLSEKVSAKPDGHEVAQAAPAEEEDEDAKVFSPRKFSDYTFNISPKLYNGLFNPDATEEERVNCLQGFASGIATTVHNKILESLGSWTKENFQAVPRAIDYILSQREKTQNSVKSIRDDFYGTFPELNRPELAPLVRATIQAVQKETRAKVWNAQLRNTVGERIKTILSAYSQPTAPKVAPKITPASVAPRVTKPTAADPNSTDAILDVFQSDFN